MKNDVYNDPILIESPKAVVKVYRPILSEVEQKKRTKAIHDSAANLLKEAEKVNSSNDANSAQGLAGVSNAKKI